MDPRLVVGEGVLRGPSGLRIRLAAGTHPGRVRERNEDAFGAFIPSEGLSLPVDAALVVSDGVGGHQGGQEASRFTVDAVRDTLASLDAVADPVPLLDALLHGIHRELLRQADERGMRGGMGATITLALLLGDHLFLAQVGDSRGYLLREGELSQLTRDDSWVAERERVAPGEGGNAEGAFGRNVLTQCLGIGASLRVQVVPVTVLPGDRYLLCSDGLHGPVPDLEIQHVLAGVADPSRAVDTLLERANAAGGPDNIAAVVFDVGPPFPAEALPLRGPGGTLPEGVPAGAGTTLPGGVPAPSGVSPTRGDDPTTGGRGRPSSRAGSALLAVGVALMVAGSAAGYRGSRMDAGPGAAVPTAVATTAAPGAETAALRGLVAAPGRAAAESVVPEQVVPDSTSPDSVGGRGTPPPDSVSPADTSSPPRSSGEPGPTADALATPDSTPTPYSPADSIPGDTIPVSPDSIPDGVDQVPTPPSEGLPHQE